VLGLDKGRVPGSDRVQDWLMYARIRTGDGYCRKIEGNEGKCRCERWRVGEESGIAKTELIVLVESKEVQGGGDGEEAVRSQSGAVADGDRHKCRPVNPYADPYDAGRHGKDSPEIGNHVFWRDPGLHREDHSSSSIRYWLFSNLVN
jgi:hypothetical protein